MMQVSVPVPVIFDECLTVTAAHYLWQQLVSHVTKWQQREAPARLFDVCSRVQSGQGVCVCGNTGMLKEASAGLNANDRCVWVCVCVRLCACVRACVQVFTCWAASPLTMWGMRGTSPFRRGGGAKSSGIWSVIIIVTYIHGEIHWTALPGKVQRERDKRRERETGEVSRVHCKHTHTHTQWLMEAFPQCHQMKYTEMFDIKKKKHLMKCFCLCWQQDVWPRVTCW